MSARARISALVAAVAAAAVVVVVGAAALQSRGAEGGATAAPVASKPKGPPPLLLDLGVRDDAEARALRRAARLYDAGRLDEAAAIFRRHDSLEARLGLLLSRWPEDILPSLRALAAAYPDSGLVRLELGLARFWAGQRAEALADWRAVRELDPDSLAAVRAGDLLHPNFPQGLPTFVPSFPVHEAVAALPPDEQLEALRDAAARGGAREKLLYGTALQRLGRPLSAREQFDAAVAADPASVEAKVAAAVGRFDKASPEGAFARLGPLAKAHPRDPSVRFHLGLLLLWLGEVDEARRQLELARSSSDAHPLAAEADRFLARLEDVGTE